MTLISKTSHNRGILLLLLTVLVWGTSFSLLKYFLRDFPPAIIIATRFAIAAVVFIPWLRILNIRLLLAGVLLGCIYFAKCSSSTLLGLETISANRSAFIISLNVILVPLLSLFLGQKLKVKILAASGLAISGIGLLSWEGGGLSWGDVFTFFAAIGAIAQRWIPAHEVALLYILEPVVATFFSFLFLGEQLGIRGFIGAALVVTATVLSQRLR